MLPLLKPRVRYYVKVVSREKILLDHKEICDPGVTVGDLLSELAPSLKRIVITPYVEIHFEVNLLADGG